MAEFDRRYEVKYLDGPTQREYRFGYADTLTDAISTRQRCEKWPRCERSWVFDHKTKTIVDMEMFE